MRWKISILSLYTEGDLASLSGGDFIWNFNPLPLYRGRPLSREARAVIVNISILSLYTEGDINGRHTPLMIMVFQSSPSIQRETNYCKVITNKPKISILSLYTEGDPPEGRRKPRRTDFNPLPLYRGRLLTRPTSRGQEKFQSSPSIQRETWLGSWGSAEVDISILSLYTEGDGIAYKVAQLAEDFNPLPLYRGRQRTLR